MNNVVSLAAVRDDRWLARRIELLVGDLDLAAMAVLETFSDEELEIFFRARKRVKSQLAEAVIVAGEALTASNIDKIIKMAYEPRPGPRILSEPL